MKRIVSSLCAFTLAFSLFGTPAAAFATQANDQVSSAETAVQGAVSHDVDAQNAETAVTSEASATLPTDAVGPVKAEDPEPEATVSEEPKAPVYNNEAEADPSEQPKVKGEAEEQPSLLDAIVGFFTGGAAEEAADPGDATADAQPDKSGQISGASLTVKFYTQRPKAMMDTADPLTLAVAGKTAAFDGVSGAGTVRTAVISDIPAGRQSVSISGSYYLPLTHEIEFKDGTKYAFDVTDYITGGVDASMADAGFVPFGDYDDNGAVDSADSQIISEAMVQENKDAKYDLSDDGKLSLKDVQLLAEMTLKDVKAPAKVTETPDGSQVDPEIPEGTSVLVDGKVVTGDAAKDAIKSLFDDATHDITLTDSVNTVEGGVKTDISPDAPVEFSWNANGLTMNRFTFYSPREGATVSNMPTQGTVTIKFEKDGANHVLDVPIPCENAYGLDDPTILPNLKVMVDAAHGCVFFDLGEDVKVYDTEFSITGASGPDTTKIQLSKASFFSSESPGPDDPTPEDPEKPLPTIPENVTATVDNQQITLSWDASRNAVGYEVQIATGDGEPETVTSTQTSVPIQSYAGERLQNGTTYSLRVQAVDKDDNKSGYTDWINATPELTTPPANPGGLKLTPSYKEISATWNAVDRADRYTLYYAKKGSSQFTPIPNLTDTKHTVRDLDNETEYTFYVVAVNDTYGSSDANKAPRVSARTTFVTTKVPWFNLINRTAQDATKYLPTGVFSSVKANGSEAEGAKLVDGNYNTIYELPANTYPTWDNATSVVFTDPHSIRHIALSTNLGEGYADDIEDVWVRYSTDARASGSFDKPSGITWTDAPMNDGSGQNAKNTIMIQLPQLLTNVRSMDVMIKRTGSVPITISELAFYEGSTLPERIDALFKPDTMMTELAEGVEQGTITALREEANAEDPLAVSGTSAKAERFWDAQTLLDKLDLAETLLRGQTARAVTTHPEIYGTTTNVRGTNALQPTGITALAGTKVQISVMPAEGTADVGAATKLKLVVAQQYGTEDALTQSAGFLNVGVNTITMPTMGTGSTERGGGLYVMYEEPNCPAYEVKVVGGHQVPLLDVYGVTDNAQLKAAAKDFATDLAKYAPSVSGIHADGNHGASYVERTCVANAAEILTSNALISLPATAAQKAFEDELSANGRDAASALSVSLPFLDKAISLLYQQAGLFDVSAAANSGTVATYGGNNALPTTHMGFRYMMAGSAGRMVTESTIGLGWFEGAELLTAPTIRMTTDDKYKSGNPYSWDLSSVMGKAVAADNAAFPAALADYYAQVITSKDKNDGQHFSYDDVTTYLASGKSSSIDALPNNLRTALLWQLRLGYDNAYSYKLYDSAADQMADSLFARMNAYMRNPSTAPNGLELDGVDADNAFIRLTCAAAKSNLIAFFEKWGIPFSDETRAYADTFSPDMRDLTLMTDDGRKGSTRTADESVRQVAATVQASEPNEAGEVTITGISLKDDVRASSNLGFEVLRQVGTDESTSQVVGFVPAGQTTFTDRLTSDNGQTLTYSVRAVDTALYHSAATEAGQVQANFPRNLNKAYWTITSTMESDDDPMFMVDGSTSTQYKGTRTAEAAGTVGGTVDDTGTYASVTIAFGKPTDACGIRYFPGSGALTGEGATDTFKRLWVLVSNDGANWTSVGYKEISPATFDTSKCATVYFTKSMVMPNAGAEGSQISVHNASYLRVSDLDTSADTPISIAEIDVIGSLPDAVAFNKVDGGEGVSGIGRTVEDIRVKAAADGVYDGAGTLIPAGSLVVSGSYTGNPAKSTLQLRDALGTVISDNARQVILAERDLGSSISYSATGTWVVYFLPGTWEDVVQDWGLISASLYRSAAAGDMEGSVMTASCPSVPVPYASGGGVAVAALDFGKWM